MRRFLAMALLCGICGLGMPIEARAQGARPISKGMLALLRVSSDLSLLNQESVQKELKLTTEQIAVVNELRASLSFRNARGEGAAPRTDEDNEKRAAEAGAKLAAELKPEQHQRLRQISWQQTRRRGLISLLGVEEFRKPLNLTAEQSTRLEALRADPKFQSQRNSFGPGGMDAEAAERTAAGDKEVETLLTGEQNARVKELLGPAFTGEIRSTASRTPDRSLGSPGPAVRTLTVELGSLHGPAVGLLNGSAVQQELKLSPEQLQKAADLRSLTRDDPMPSLDFLTAEQRERLNQLSLQFAAQRYGPLGPLYSAATLNALALTAEQRKTVESIAAEDRAAYAALGARPDYDKVFRLNRETQEMLDRVLNEEQRAMLQKAKGDAFRGVLSTSTSSPMFSPAPRPFQVGVVTRNAANFVELPDVQTDLKLTDEQRAKIAALPSRFGVRNPQDMVGVLTAGQTARLSQIQYQILQQRSGPAYVFRYVDFVEPLKLTDGQKEQIQKLGQAAAEARDAARDDDRARQKLDEILTEEQRIQLKTLLGEPYRGAIPPARGRTNPADNALTPPRGR